MITPRPARKYDIADNRYVINLLSMRQLLLFVF